MRMQYRLIGAAIAVALAAPAASADYDVVFGKNKDWLFTGYEYMKPADAGPTKITVENLIEASKLFKQNGTALAIMLVPSKIRVYEDQLPGNRPLNDFTRTQYKNAVTALRAGGVNVVDLDKAFTGMADRYGDNQLFFRLDTHWAPKGAMVAAETIKATVDATPALKSAYAATKPVEYTLAWSPRARPTRSRDLVNYLPPGTATFPPEQIKSFRVTRAQASSAGLTGDGDAVEVTVIGSSFSNANTGYPDAVRYALQRDVLDISLPVDQGPWSGMVGYLGKEFKTNKPKLVIWEIPERELRSPPAADWREARYRIDNAKWLSDMRNLLK